MATGGYFADHRHIRKPRWNSYALLEVLCAELFSLFFWPAFPAAMHPPVLARIFPHEFFDSFGIFGRDPFQRVVLVGPFFGEDNAIDTEFEIEAIFNSPAITDYDRHIFGYSKQAYALISACFSAEEIDENPFFAGVLIGNETERCTSRSEFFHERCCALFVDNPLPGGPADSIKISADVFVIQRPGDAVDLLSA